MPRPFEKLFCSFTSVVACAKLLRFTFKIQFRTMMRLYFSKYVATFWGKLVDEEEVLEEALQNTML